MVSGAFQLSSMRIVGLEPTRGHPRKILSLVRLPFRHIRIAYVATQQNKL